MGLLDTDVIQKNVSDEVKRYKATMKLMADYIEATHTRLFNNFWSHRKYTPEEICGEYGTDAVALFEASEKIQALIASLKADYVPLVPPRAYTKNEDGTVTIGEQP